MSEELQKIEMGTLQATSPAELVSSATDMANVLSGVIDSKKLYKDIQGNKYVQVEGWTTCAALMGLMPTEISTQLKRTEGEVYAESVVALVRMSDGQELSRASAICGTNDDGHWGKAQLNAKRSMAITRATSKVCRNSMAWIVTLAGFKTTPAEEMEMVRQPTAKAKQAPPSAQTRGKTEQQILKESGLV